MTETLPLADKRQPTWVAPSVNIDGVQIAALSLGATADRLVEAVGNGSGGLVLTHNLEHLRQIRENAAFRRLAQAADLAVADGMPIVWASKISGCPLPGRVNGTDLMLELLDRLNNDSASVYFAGGLDGTAARAAAVAQRRYPNLRIAGARSPASGLSDNHCEVVELSKEIAAAKPDLLFIGLPSFLQASLGTELIGLLPGTVVVGVGVSFSYLAGELPRAPRWMQRNGLEWLHRLRTQPRELGTRYLVRCAPLGVELMIRSARVRWRSLLVR